MGFIIDAFRFNPDVDRPGEAASGATRGRDPDPGTNYRDPYLGDEWWRKPSWEGGIDNPFSGPPPDPYGLPTDPRNFYIDPVSALITTTIKTLINTFLPDVGVWVNENVQGINGPYAMYPGGFSFTPKQAGPGDIDVSPLPIPQFDTGLSLQKFTDNSPKIVVGELAFDTLRKNAVQLSSKEFVVDVKPAEWQMIEALYGIRIYDSSEWEYQANLNYPGWRAKIYRGIYDTFTDELTAVWSYRPRRRVG